MSNAVDDEFENDCFLDIHLWCITFFIGALDINKAAKFKPVLLLLLSTG